MSSDSPLAPGAPATTTGVGDDPVLGLRIGVYRLLSVLGQGGMGIVYLAEQEQPVKRRVALKLIKLGMDTREVVARFDSERQALALMTHPNIAKVFDAGLTEHGRSYFVMEYVPGVPITEYCNEQRLPNRARLELFVSVCEALHHAHQKGIVHRDVKPANILVSVQDGRPFPRIIDFGIAKALHQRLVEATIVTQRGLLIGTPEYMSPEQAGMNALDIDTSSDVYSLGVVLYELLVGVLPFEAARLRNAGYDEIRRIIREEDIVRPSTRLTRMGEEANAVASRHRTDLRALYRELRGDLDWVTLKATEKDRTLRYPSASEFATDIRRYLADEPVLARPPSAAYRMQKLYRRRRGAIFGAVFLIGALGLGLVTSLFLYAKTRQANIRAQREAYIATIRAADLSLRNADVGEARYRLEQAAPELREWEWRYLASRLDSSARVLKAGLAVHQVAWSGAHELSAIGQQVFPESRWRALAWSADGDTPSTVTEPTVQKNMISDVVAASADGRLVLASEAVVIQQQNSWSMKDPALRLYDRRSGVVLRQMGSGSFPFEIGAFSPDGTRVAVATQAEASRLHIWLTSGGTPVTVTIPESRLTVPGPRLGGPRCIEFSANNTHIAYAAYGSVFLVDSMGHRRFMWDTPSTEGTCVLAFSPDGSLLLMLPSSGPGRAHGRLWDTSAGRLVGVIDDNWWTAAAFSPDGRSIAAGAWDGRIQIIDVPRFDGQSSYRTHATSTFFGHRARVRSLAFSPDAFSLASGSDDSTVRVWDATFTGEYRTFRAERGHLSALSVSHDGSRIASAEGLVAHVWRTRPSTTLARTGLHESQITSAALNKDGSKLVTGTADGTIRLWSVGEASPAWTSKAYDGRVNAVAIDPDGAFVASGGSDHLIHVWDTKSKQELRALEGHKAPVTALIVDPNRQLIISGSDDATVRIWNVRDARLVRTLTQHRESISSLALTSDGKRLLSSSADRTVRVWDLPSGAEIAILRGHSAAVTSAVFNSDGTRIASASLDRTVRVWDSALGVPLLTLANGEDPPSSVLFLADGTRLLAASYSGTFRIWESSATSVLTAEPSDRGPSGAPQPEVTRTR